MPHSELLQIRFSVQARPVGRRGRSSPPAAPVQEELVLGVENRLVQVVWHAVLNETHPDEYNPIVVHGAPGIGKSFFGQALAAEWRTRHHRGVIREAAGDFARRLADAIHTHGIEEFRRKYRAARLWILDDVHLLAGKTSAQQELVATIDARLALGHRTVCLLPDAPAAITEFLPGVRSRLLGGLVVPLVAPRLPARLAILKRFNQNNRFFVSNEALQLIAKQVDGSPNELTGALLAFAMRVKSGQETPDSMGVRRFLKDHATCEPAQIHQITSATAKMFGLKASELRSSSRRQAIVRARGVAIFLARAATPLSFEQIGQYLGGRDHTTVLHAFRKTEEELKKDPTIRQTLLNLCRELSISRLPTV